MIDWVMLRNDLCYLFLNCFVCKIPSWNLRKPLYKLLGVSLGKDSRIGLNTIIVSPKKITLGSRSIINNGCYLDGSGGIQIGNDVSISSDVKICSATHKIDSDIFEYITKSVSIEDNVWIGTGAVILENSLLRELTIIGAGCVFKGSSDAQGVYIGNPAQKIKLRKLATKYCIDFHPYFR